MALAAVAIVILRFLGPVTSLRGMLVRPHDVELFPHPDIGTVPARMSRPVRLGLSPGAEVHLRAEISGAHSAARTG